MKDLMKMLKQVQQMHDKMPKVPAQLDTENVEARIGYCERCYNLTDGSLCVICSSPKRDTTLLCVAESALDVLAVERTSEFGGVYVVFHGVISPIDGIGPDQIHVQQLLDRVRDDS